ncbi:MAG: TRAP transporter permease [Chloroflexota bacterium]
MSQELRSIETTTDAGTRRIRVFTGWPARLVTGATALFAIYVLLYIGRVFTFFGLYIYPVQHSAISLLFAMVLCYLLFPARRAGASKKIPWYDLVAILLSMVVNVYLIANYDEILSFQRPANVLEITLGCIDIVLILEAVRRSVSPILTILGILFAIYPLISNYMPGFLYGPAIDFQQVITIFYLFPEGIYGRILQIFSNLLIVFLLFGAFLAVSGAGQFFIDVALALVGHIRGGPAKVAVIASALLGTINGSSMANAATSGVITIPLMKSIGYKPTFAAAVEAVASNGGQIMPPVMGLAAFLMVDFLEVPYRTIVIAGFLPAILYFIAVLCMVDFEAAKNNLRGIPRQDLPSLRKTLAGGWFYLLPIAVLVFFMMVLQYSAETSCIYALATMVAVSFFKKESRMGPRKLVAALSQGVRTIPDIGCVIALAGILTISLSLTGLDVRMTGGLIGVAGGNLFLLFVLTAVIALILGMALPTSGTYLLCAMLLAPSLVKMGTIPIVAHFFVLYYGVAALITPPICVVVFITASIAGAPFLKTGLTAVRLGLVTFVVPFIFVYSPELLMIGSVGQIVLASVTAIIGVIFLAGAMEGYFLDSTTWPIRVLLLVAGLTMIVPGWMTDVIGVAAGALALLWQIGLRKGVLGKKIPASSGNKVSE